jgi:hypothetical protein
MRLVFRVFSLLLMVGGLLAAQLAPAAAQNMDVSFSDVKLRELGYPEITITVGEDGVDAPSELAAGYYLITLQPTKEYSTYLDIMQPPAGLSTDEATRLALDAAANDLAQSGWGYLGGTNTFEVGVPVSFAIYLAPGEYAWAASYYQLSGEGDEIMKLVPLTVTGGATPEATTAEATPAAGGPKADVRLEMTDDLVYMVSPDPLPTGPQIWEVANTGTKQSHHLVMQRIPEGTTAEQILAEFGGMMAGTPPAQDSIAMQAVYVGYAALQSGGYTTYQEFDLDPGTYAVICFIIDPETGMPHVMNGMVTVFTVE